MIGKSELSRILIAVGMVVLIFAATIFIVNYGNNETEKKEEIELSPDSDIVSTDPRVSAANFIKHNGTMGDLSVIDQEYFKTPFTEDNSERRMNAFKKVKDAIIPDSPLLSRNIEKFIEEYVSDFHVYYEIRDLKVGEPSEVTPLTIHHNQIGSIEYDSVEVKVDFTSAQNIFYWPTDATGDSIITQMEAVDHFEDVTVILVKSGDLWYIYDVVDSEYLLNVRMATWSGRGVDDVSVDQKVVAEYKINYGVKEEDEE